LAGTEQSSEQSIKPKTHCQYCKQQKKGAATRIKEGINL